MVMHIFISIDKELEKFISSIKYYNEHIYKHSKMYILYF